MNRWFRRLADYLKSLYRAARSARKTPKSQAVQGHLDQAQAAAQRGQWQQADAALDAAAVAATGYRELQDLVRSASERIHQAVAEYWGRQFADAVEAARLKQFVRARQRLVGVDAPPSFHAVIQHLGSLIDLLEQLDRSDGPAEEQLQWLVDQSRTASDSALGTAAFPVLGAIADVAADWGLEELVPALLEVIADKRLPLEDRKEITQALARIEAPAFDAVVRQLAGTPSSEQAGHWLLDLLADLSPGRHASALVTCFAGLGSGPRANLVAWIARAFGSKNDMLFELLAGVLNRLPPDRRFASAVQAEIGADRLRQAALQWAARGHKSARVVYDRM